MTNLSTRVKPAIPTEKTQLLIEGNAKNWKCTTMIIPRDHYLNIMEAELETLSQLSLHKWEDPFHVSSFWVRKKLGRRLKEETLGRIQDLIFATMGHRGIQIKYRTSSTSTTHN